VKQHVLFMIILHLKFFAGGYASYLAKLTTIFTDIDVYVHCTSLIKQETIISTNYIMETSGVVTTIAYHNRPKIQFIQVCWQKKNSSLWSALQEWKENNYSQKFQIYFRFHLTLEWTQHSKIQILSDIWWEFMSWINSICQFAGWQLQCL